MKIVEIRSENFKKLKLVDITPEEDVVIISGRNAQGKTSILDSIWATLDGRTVPDKPIRDGAEKAETKVVLGENDQIKYIVKRTFTDAGNYLSVTTPDGAKFTSPQKLLDSFIGDLSFDPLSFTRLKEKEQHDLLLRIVKFTIDQKQVRDVVGKEIQSIDELDLIRKETFDERTQMNREVSSVEKQLNAFPVVAKTEKVSIKDLVDKKTTIDDEVRYQQEEVRNLEKNRETIEATQALILDLEQKILQARKTEKEVLSKIEQAEERIKGFVDYTPQLTEINQKLQEADILNERANQYQKNQELKQIYNEKKYSADLLTRKLDQIDTLKVNIIASSQMPIKGLSFVNDTVTFKDIPFIQASDAQKLTVSLAIAMALNPKLRVIRITDGSLLDDDSMKIVQQMAKDKDYQVWIEKVDSSGQIGIYIEEGEVVKK